jgi:hypothetical protein
MVVGGTMKVFVSSVITGLEAEREACASAILSVGSEVVRSEDLGARPGTPRQVCLSEVARSDALVAVFDRSFGFIPVEDNPKRLSVTALEVEAARTSGKPILIIVRRDRPDREPELAAYLRGLTDFDRGVFVVFYSSLSDLRGVVSAAVRRLISAAPGSSSKPHEPRSVTATNTGPGIAIAVGTGNVTIERVSTSQTGPTPEEWLRLLTELRTRTHELASVFRELGDAGRAKDVQSAGDALTELAVTVQGGAENPGHSSGILDQLRPLARDVRYVMEQIAIGVAGNAAFSALASHLARVVS